MRTPTPWTAVTDAPVAAPTVLALISQIEFEQSESPVTAPATPNCCCCPDEQPRSSELVRMRSAFLIGFTVMQVGCAGEAGSGPSRVVVNSGTPSPVTSVHVVLGPPH